MISDLYLMFKVLVFLMLPGIPYVMIFADRMKLDILEKIAFSFGFSLTLIPLLLFWLNIFIGLKINFISGILVYVIVLSVPILVFLLRNRGKKVISFDIRHFSKPEFLLAIFILFFSIILNSYGVLSYKYIVPPGDDVFGHIANIADILSTGNILSEQEWYPAGFHNIIAVASYIINENPLTVVKYFYPFLLPLSLTAIYTFIKEGYGAQAATFGLIIAMFSQNPKWSIGDGAYPNVLGTYFILILSFTLLAKSLESKNLRYSLIGGIFFSSLPLWHILSFVEGLVVLFVAVLISFLIDVIRKRLGNTVRAMLAFVGVFAILGSYPFVKIFLPDIMYSTLANPSVQPTQNILPLSLYPQNLGEIAFYFGCASLLFFPLMLRRKKYFTLLLACWLTTTFLMTRTSLFIFPQRYLRDLGAPLILSSSIFYCGLDRIFCELKYIRIILNGNKAFAFSKLSEIKFFFHKKAYKTHIRKLCVLAITGVVFLHLLPTNINLVLDYLTYDQMVRVREVDYKNILWLKGNIDNSVTILASPYSDYLRAYLSNKIIVIPPHTEGIAQFSPLRDYAFAFYNPNTLKGMQIINRKNYTLWRTPTLSKEVPVDIGFIYAGRKPDGWVDPVSRWDYNEEFVRSLYLKPVYSYSGTTIYYVRQDLLEELIKSFHNQTSALNPCENLEGVSSNSIILKLSSFAKQGNHSIEATINTTITDWQTIKISFQRTLNFEQVEYLCFWFLSTHNMNGVVWIEDVEHNFIQWDLNYGTPFEWKNVVLPLNKPHLVSEKPLTLSQVESMYISFKLRGGSDTPITFWIDDISTLRH